MARALDVKCPTCGSQPGKWCRSIAALELVSAGRVAKHNGTKIGYQREPHASRVEAAGGAS